MDTQGKNNKEAKSSWRKYFSGKNFLVNALIAFIPAVLLIGILNVLGIRGALVTIFIFYVFIYFSGLIREKLNDRKHKKKVQEVSENKNDSPKSSESIEKRQIEATDEIMVNEDNSKLDTEQKQFKVVDKSQDKDIRKKRFWMLFVLIAIVLTAILAYNLLTKEDENISLMKTEKDSNYSEQVGNLYRNTKYHFRIKFPKGWEIGEGDGVHIVQKASFGKSTISIIVLQFDLGREEEISSIKEVFTLEEFVKTTSEGLAEKFSDVKVINYGETKIDNEPAYWIEYSASSQILDNKVNMTGLVYYLAKGDTIYSINSGTATDEYPDIKPLILQSVSTFVFEN